MTPVIRPMRPPMRLCVGVPSADGWYSRTRLPFGVLSMVMSIGHFYDVMSCRDVVRGKLDDPAGSGSGFAVSDEDRRPRGLRVRLRLRQADGRMKAEGILTLGPNHPNHLVATISGGCLVCPKPNPPDRTRNRPKFRYTRRQERVT